MNYSCPGIIHIHSKYSDGTQDITYIAAKAKQAGMRWIIITDHNNIKGFSEEGWYDDVAVLVGEEVSPDFSDHYLALGIKQEISPQIPPEEYIRQVKEQGGIGFIAHPDESNERKNSFKPLRWTNWDIDGFDGLEIWNYMSDWVDNMSSKTLFFDYMFRHNILSGPSDKVLNWWDSLNNKYDNIIPAIGGADSHEFKYKLFNIEMKIFTYADCFKTLVNNLYLENELSDSFAEAKLQILNAVKVGNNTIINRIHCKKIDEIKIYATDGQNIIPSGSVVNNDKNIKFVVNLPKNAIIKLIHNGKIIKEAYNKQLIYSNPLSGKYRVEVYNKKHPWIFSNPIKII